MDQSFRIIASVYRSLIEILQEAGIETQSISQRVGADVTALIASQEMLSLEQVTALWQLGYETRGPTIGVEVALRVRLVDYQDVGVYLTATEDVADVLHQLENYCALFSNVVDVKTASTRDGIEFTLHYNATVPLLHERLDFLAISGPVLVSQYLGRPLRLARAELTRPAPDDTRPWDEAFGVTVTWDAPITRFVVSHEESKRRVLTRNEQLRRELKFLLDRRLRADRRAHPLDEIRAVMKKQFARQVPNIETVTAALHISARTLQRRLTDANTTFSDLLSELRREMAENYLHLGMPVSAVAERLGYSDLRTFNRAFKRWLGQTPAQYQQDQTRPDSSGSP